MEIHAVVRMLDDIGADICGRTGKAAASGQ